MERESEGGKKFQSVDNWENSKEDKISQNDAQEAGKMRKRPWKDLPTDDDDTALTSVYYPWVCKRRAALLHMYHLGFIHPLREVPVGRKHKPTSSPNAGSNNQPRFWLIAMAGNVGVVRVGMETSTGSTVSILPPSPKGRSKIIWTNHQVVSYYFGSTHPRVLVVPLGSTPASLSVPAHWVPRPTSAEASWSTSEVQASWKVQPVLFPSLSCHGVLPYSDSTSNREVSSVWKQSLRE